MAHKTKESRRAWYAANSEKINARQREKYHSTKEPVQKRTDEERRLRKQRLEAEYYQKNKRRKNNIRKEAIKEKKAWIWAFKEKRGCITCGVTHPAILDFHHLVSSEKSFAIGAATNHNYALDRIKQEIEKCEVMCRNCHAMLHWHLDKKETDNMEYLAEEFRVRNPDTGKEYDIYVYQDGVVARTLGGETNRVPGLKRIITAEGYAVNQENDDNFRIVNDPLNPMLLVRRA